MVDSSVLFPGSGSLPQRLRIILDPDLTDHEGCRGIGIGLRGDGRDESASHSSSSSVHGRAKSCGNA